MNIIIAQQGPDGTTAEEQTFSKNVIAFGRNAAECDVAFDKMRFPMVSRTHAELRWDAGVWKIIDLDSSYGTFLNEQRIDTPRRISFGDVIRFGKDGPRYRIVWFEMAADPNAVSQPVPHPMATANPAMPKAPTTPSIPLDPQFYGETKSPDDSQQFSAPAYLDFTDGRSSYKFSKPSTWLGRGLDCDIIFDASSATVSRRHAEIIIRDGKYLIVDNNSFNGTLVNEQRVSATTELFHHDQIRLGMGGPVIRFNAPHRPAPLGSSMPGQRAVASEHAAPKPKPEEVSGSKTMVFKLDPSMARASQGSAPAGEAQLLMSLDFGTADKLTIGRADGNDIKLDGLQISNRHARLVRSGGRISAEDLGSTNGIYIDGERVSRGALDPGRSLQVGTFLIRVDESGTVFVHDGRSNMRIDVADIIHEARSSRGRGKVRLLDGISLSIRPNEFVGVLGPSGAGKSTLLDLLSGKRKPSKGTVNINGTSLYRHLDSLKHSIGYVPQEDIIHRELSVYRTLYYVAKLRLSRDVSSAEVRRIVDEVLDVTGLSEHRNSPVAKLSGGQRKRVSIAVELITKPSVIYLDEPTSGLDPATEEKIMQLFRQMSAAGRTVVMTTHAMENVRLFDKIVVLMSGKLVYYGPPEEALKYFDVANFKELYDKLEEPVEREVAVSGEGRRAELTEQRAEELKRRFAESPQYQSLAGEAVEAGSAGRGKKKRLGIFGSIRQFFTLSRRYFEVLLKDKLTLFILLAQAPVIALMTFFVTASDQPRDFVYFVVALVAVWFGTSVSAREIVRERPVYARERMYNLGILPYVASKFVVLGFIVLVQCLLLFVPLKVIDLVGLMAMPGELFGIPQLWAMLLTAGVGIATGLLVSALVRTQSMAASLVPLILIPQILFSGIAGVPHGVSRAASMLMPAAWSFDTLKRFSTLDTLEPEGAAPNGETKGMGLYEFIESENETMVNDAKKKVDEIRSSAEAAAEDPTLAGPLISDIPDIEEMKKMPEDRSRYITFLHPWMHEVLNQIVLMLMFGIMAIATLVVMRLKDIR